MIRPEDLQGIDDREKLFQFLGNKLQWAVSAEDTFMYPVRLEDQRLPEIAVGRIPPFTGNDPFAIFLVESEKAFRRNDLREILRQIRAQIRKEAAFEGRGLEEIIFICASEGHQDIRFAHFTEQEGRQPKLSSFGWDRDSGDGVRTLCEYNLPALNLPQTDLFGEIDWGAGRNQWLGAWNVQHVTIRFFETFRQRFSAFFGYLRKQGAEPKWAHDFTLQTFSRIIFLYFIQKKPRPDGEYWLGNDKHFVSSLLRAYKESAAEPNSFYSHWLSVLFFEAFTGDAKASLWKYKGRFPGDIIDALGSAPYLNGGLFAITQLDEELDCVIPDCLLCDYLSFLDSYNFTVAETTPLDIEVAVDPEMLGRIYESMVNLETEEGEEFLDEKANAGIFYTPRIEIDMMCRLSVVDWLCNHLGEEWRSLFYRTVFASALAEKADADKEMTENDLWGRVDSLLRQITVVDPACGSGSFLVGMLLVLDDLRARANKVLGENEPAHRRRKEIIGHSLYGVDCKEWAVRMAELRLWLQLVVETDLSQSELVGSPLLPNLSFKIRVGDSLVQDIGNVNLCLHQKHTTLSRSLSGRLKQLKGEKLHFFRNEPSTVLHSKEQLEAEELSLFQAILLERQTAARQSIHRIDIEKLGGKQATLDGSMVDAVSGKERSTLEEEQRVLVDELDQLTKARDALASAKTPPFVWDIAFVEVFEDGNRGFDIVIGNPPYVRQEKITDPLERWTDPAQYKARLRRSAYAAYPDFFGYRAHRDVPDKPEAAVTRKIDGKSDLYIFFYLHGLKLLNEKGSFCFITSNSWLDVGYGADLQELLLRQGQVRLAIDNEVKRSFSEAEVNTVILLLSPPCGKKDCGLSLTARFVSFRVPFEDALSTVLFEEIDEAQGRVSRPEFRVITAGQSRLLREGLKEKESPRDQKRIEYVGGKWGGKYLRAPDIYWTIIDRAGDRLVPLGSIAEVRFGIKTGANDFFYVDQATVRQWGIESKFLRRAVKSPRDYYTIHIPETDILQFWCQAERSKLSGTGALRYIEWGEGQGYHKVPSCASRKNWYSLRGPESPVLLWPSAFFERHIVYECPPEHVADKVFYTLSGNVPIAIRAFLNSSVTSLFVEVEGYQLNHGGIFVTTEWLAELPVFAEEDETLDALYTDLCLRPILLTAEEQRDPSRRKLDERVLQLLGFEDAATLDALYEAVRLKVAGRIHKSGRGLTKAGREGNA